MRGIGALASTVNRSDSRSPRRSLTQAGESKFLEDRAAFYEASVPFRVGEWTGEPRLVGHHLTELAGRLPRAADGPGGVFRAVGQVGELHSTRPSSFNGLLLVAGC